MTLDDLDISHRQKTAARQVANTLGNDVNVTAYDRAAYGGGLKPAFLNYAGNVSAAIQADGRITTICNQNTGVQTNNFANLAGWLAAGRTAFWVHCFSNNMPANAQFRCYVCADLAQTSNLLALLLAGYQAPRTLYFKVADHDEAQLRNDTIVSWHDTLADARTWADIARANPGMLLGNAPAGTYGGAGVAGVGIDAEVAGQTTTGKTADAGTKIATAKNPYI